MHDGGDFFEKGRLKKAKLLPKRLSPLASMNCRAVAIRISPEAVFKSIALEDSVTVRNIHIALYRHSLMRLPDA